MEVQNKNFIKEVPQKEKDNQSYPKCWLRPQMAFSKNLELRKECMDWIWAVAQGKLPLY